MHLSRTDNWYSPNTKMLSKMKKKDVLTLLKTNQDERGIRHWNNRCAKDSKLRSFGIGLTKLRKLAKQVGRDHDLALELWQSDGTAKLT